MRGTTWARGHTVYLYALTNELIAHNTSVVFFLVFFVMGIVGNLFVATVAYFKLGHWGLETGVINGSLTVALYCEVPVGAGIWMSS